MKRGDIVICIDNAKGHYRPIIGKKYEILDIDMFYITILDDNDMMDCHKKLFITQEEFRNRKIEKILYE